jgi:hypothetical protein
VFVFGSGFAGPACLCRKQTFHDVIIYLRLVGFVALLGVTFA